jgi:hypothetical protein
LKEKNALGQWGKEKTLPAIVQSRLLQFPQNKRRRVNKVLFQNSFFELSYSTTTQQLKIASRGDLVYSAIPYDTARNYIQRAAVQYLLHPESVDQYLEKHQATLAKYFGLGIFQLTNQQKDATSSEVKQAFADLERDPLFKIQVVGRLLQHDETGALSANLAGKFLYQENKKTGIAEYVSEYLNFLLELTTNLPLATDGKSVEFLAGPPPTGQPFSEGMHHQLSATSLIDPTILLPTASHHVSNPKTLTQTKGSRKPLLRSEYGEELQAVRKNYTAHSIHPEQLEPYFQEASQLTNHHLLNVVSDIHAKQPQLPFTNSHFNILAGDVADVPLVHAELQGIQVLGNHELVTVLPTTRDFTQGEWDCWRPYFKFSWFNKLVANPAEAWPELPLGNHRFYKQVQRKLAERFPQMTILNNERLVHEGICYIGLTIPVVFLEKKERQQKWLLQILKKLLAENPAMPTVIVSHAPIFNELSLLSPSSQAYRKAYTCANESLKKLFAEANIIGVIHGHHHIPASSGRVKKVEFAGRERFIVCSIYSTLNSGFELQDVLPQ